MSVQNHNEPSNRFKFKPDFTDVNGWFILILLIVAILFGVVLVGRFYFLPVN